MPESVRADRIKRYEIQRWDALTHHPDKLEKRIEYLNKTKKLLNEHKNINWM